MQSSVKGNNKFMKGKSCLNNLIFFDDKITCLVEKEMAVNVGCLVVGFFACYFSLV